MRIDSKTKIQELLNAVDKCIGDVYLKSAAGDCYNLKSELSKYVALGALIQDKYEQLEIFCADKRDEHYFYELFINDPDLL